VKEKQGEVKDHGSTAERPHADRLRQYARLCSCFVADLGVEITSSVPEDNIFERERCNNLKLMSK